MKEKIINYIETLEAKSLQVDDYFKQRNELYISNQEKDKEIEGLNKRIKELEEGFKATTEDLCEESTKIERAIEYILGNDLDNFNNINNLLNILKGSESNDN